MEKNPGEDDTVLKLNRPLKFLVHFRTVRGGAPPAPDELTGCHYGDSLHTFYSCQRESIQQLQPVVFLLLS